MSRYEFTRIKQPDGSEVKPFAVFGVITQGHERLMNTAKQRYEAVARPAAEKTGLGDLVMPGGLLDIDKLNAHQAKGEEEQKQVMMWSNLIANAHIDWTCQKVAIITHELSGDLKLLNSDLDQVKWPKIDWASPEETVRIRAALLMAYIPHGDVEPLKEAAMEHYRKQRLPDGALGKSSPPSSAPLSEVRAAPSQMTAAPALVTSG